MGFTWDLWDEMNSSPLKIGLLPQKERIVFQPAIFRGENISFREGKRSRVA